MDSETNDRSRIRQYLCDGSHLQNHGGRHEDRFPSHGALRCFGACHRHLHWLCASCQLHAPLVLLD
jgi:hypothetical protein